MSARMEPEPPFEALWASRGPRGRVAHLVFGWNETGKLENGSLRYGPLCGFVEYLPEELTMDDIHPHCQKCVRISKRWRLTGEPIVIIPVKETLDAKGKP